MECVGAERVFGLSIERLNLRYVDFLGDGESKSYASVKDIYPNLQIKNLECLGHYQKGVT